MIEQQRLQYLASLGIESYVPKRVLANAAISPALVAYEPPVAVLAEPTAPTAKTTESDNGAPELVAIDSAEPIPEAASNVDAPASNITVDAPIPSVTSAGPASTPVVPQSVPVIATAKPSGDLRFVLSLWAITPQLLVIDTRQIGSALPTDKLLQNILRALGYPLAQLPPSELVRWPIFKGDPQANNIEEAQAMVQANIHARCAKTPGMQMLVMGETAAQFVASTHEQYQNYQAQLGQALGFEQWNASLVVLPSLDQLLKDPSNKAIVWKAIQGLQRDSSA